MKNLKILNIDDLYAQQCNYLIYDTIYGHSPKNLRQIFDLKQNEMGYSLRETTMGMKEIQEKGYRLTQSKRSFLMAGPTYWNAVDGVSRGCCGFFHFLP